MSEFLIEQIELDGTFLRSISLTRDLHSPESLDNYLITPAVLTVLRQIGGALHAGSAQRAWKVMGPYGSGKSALGLLIARLLDSKHADGPLAQQLHEVAPEIAAAFRAQNNRFALAVSGSRVSLGEALAQAMLDALASLPKSRIATQFARQVDLASSSYRELPINAAVGAMLGDFVAVVQTAGYRGALLLVDELGKFIEHAALHPEGGDLMALQQIAEAASHSTDDRLLVMAMLHQHFDAYARGVGRSLSEEWHKVSARFDDVPFDEPVERYAYFAKHALAVQAPITEKVDYQQKARSLYATSATFNFFRSIDGDAVLGQAEVLYPLHPAALASLAVISKRFGQSERSFHAFMRGHEVGALRDFATTTAASPDAWYTLPHLYDYLAAGSGLHFRDLEQQRRWDFACSVIERGDADLSELQVQLLKALAVIELVAATLHVVTTAELLAFTVMSEGGAVEEVQDALAGLAFRSILQHRHANNDYVFAVSTAVNIEALFQETLQRSEQELMFSGIAHVLSDRSVIASRHYQQTGTLRSARVVAGAPETIKAALAQPTQHDGTIGLMFVDAAMIEQANNAQQIVVEMRDPQTLSAIIRVGEQERAALIEYSRWAWVHDQVKSRLLDPWTERHVETQLGRAREQVARLVLAILNRQHESNNSLSYWYAGEVVVGSQSMNMSQAASWLFDRVFNSAPVIHNELINKDKPSSAITLARQRLFELLDKNGDQELLGLSDFPPERLLYGSLLQSTRLHRQVGKRWQLSAPDKDSGEGIRKVWAELDAALKADDQISFADVIARLALPPLGVRNGPASIWCVTYLLVNRDSCAIFERGSLVIAMTPEHLQRMFRSPQTFKLRRFDTVSERKDLVQDYAAALGSVGVQVGIEATYLDVAREMIRWYMRLPQYTQETLRVSSTTKALRDVLKRATDPVALLAQDIPRVLAVGQSSAGGDFRTLLGNSLTELGLAFRYLQDEISQAMGQAFSIAGPLKLLRSQLQAECADVVGRLVEADLKAFIMRCSDITLTDDKWLDSIASVVVHRPLDVWTDSQVPLFASQVKALCKRYKRWLQVAMSDGELERHTQRFVGLTLTLPSGEEAAMLLTADTETQNAADLLVDEMTQQAGGDRDRVAATLAQALMKLQSTANTEKKERAHEQRTAG
jgi:hypothetical protein